MIYQVDPFKWEITMDKANSRLPAVLNRIYDACPGLVIEAAEDAKVPWTTMEQYIHQGRTIEYWAVHDIITVFERWLGIDCRTYRLPDIKEEPRIHLQSIKFKSWKERAKTPADHYHFLCYVRDLVENDIRLFNAMRVYATL